VLRCVLQAFACTCVDVCVYKEREAKGVCFATHRVVQFGVRSKAQARELSYM